MLYISISIDDSLVSVKHRRGSREHLIYSGMFDSWPAMNLRKKFGRCIRLCYYGKCVASLDRTRDSTLYQEIRSNSMVLIYENPEGDTLFLNKEYIFGFHQKMNSYGFEIISTMLAESDNHAFSNLSIKNLNDRHLCMHIMDLFKRSAYYVLITILLLSLLNYRFISTQREIHQDIMKSLSDKMAPARDRLKVDTIQYPTSYIIDRLAVYAKERVRYKRLSIGREKIELEGVFMQSEHLSDLMSDLKNEDFVKKIEVGDIKKYNETLTEFKMVICSGK